MWVVASALAAPLILAHLSIRSPSVMVIPSSLPVSGQLTAPAITTKPQWPQGWHGLSLMPPRFTSPIEVKQIWVKATAPMVYVSGKMKASGNVVAKDVWIKVLQLAKQASNDDSWIYDVPLDAKGQFHHIWARRLRALSAERNGLF